jgi:magnesium-transporting ATPase (P-type)
VADKTGLERAWSLDVDEVVRRLETNPQVGLSDAEAARRLAASAPDRLRPSAPMVLWRWAFAQFQDPLIYLLIAALGVSLLAWFIEGRHAWPVDTLVIALIVIVNGTLSYLQEARARKVAASLAAGGAAALTVLRDGRPLSVAVAELVPGDVIVLQAGDMVGADARVVGAEALRVREAWSRGDGQPVPKVAAKCDDQATPADRMNMVFKDSVVVEGTATAIVTATGGRSQVAGLGVLDPADPADVTEAADAADATGLTDVTDATDLTDVTDVTDVTDAHDPAGRQKPTPLQDEVLHLARMLGIAVIGVATMIIVTIMLISDIRDAGDVVAVLLLGVSFALAAVPQGLPALLATALSTGARRMARHKAILKSLASVEMLGSCTVICFDTGEASWIAEAGTSNDARVAVSEAHRAGIRTLLVTGEDAATAAREAADLGIIESGTPVLTGVEIDELDESAFAVAVRAHAVHAALEVRHKLRIVEALRLQGQVVAMAGAGADDAPALQRAHLGIAMSSSGAVANGNGPNGNGFNATGPNATGPNASGALRHAAGMIVGDGRFATLIDAVREARGIFGDVRRFLRYLLSSHMAESLTVLLGVVLAGFLGLGIQGQAAVLPLLATQILWINLITGPAPAVAMILDRRDADVMAGGPHPAAEPAMDARLWAGVIGTGALMAAAALLTLDLYLPGGIFEGSQSLDNARTAAFTVLVLAQLLNSLGSLGSRGSPGNLGSSGSDGRPGSAHGRSASDALRRVFAKRWLLSAIGIAVLLQVAVVHLPFLNVAFGTVPLAPLQWLVCVAMASLVLWPGGARRLVRYASVNRRKGRRV